MAIMLNILDIFADEEQKLMCLLSVFGQLCL